MYFAIDSCAAVLADKVRLLQVSFNRETDLMLYLHINQDKQPSKNSVA